MNERISVLMPAYNREVFIKHAIMSILAQSHNQLELIVYDDGSSDGTCDVVRDYMTKDGRIRLIEGAKNQGVAYARNRLLGAVRTRHACWQDSDDISNIHRLALQLAEMKTTGSALVFSQYEMFDNNKFINKIVNPRRWEKPPDKGVHTNRCFATVMFEITVAVLFDETKKLGNEDWLWLNEIERTHTNFPILEDLLYYIRGHNDRIGTWKRRLAHIKSTQTEAQMSYEELIRSGRK